MLTWRVGGGQHGTGRNTDQQILPGGGGADGRSLPKAMQVIVHGALSAPETQNTNVSTPQLEIQWPG